MHGRTRRTAIEAGIAAALAFVISLIALGPVLRWIGAGWAGGDMLSTYVNTNVWGGFAYERTNQFGFPLGMDLNYFPNTDITENTFASAVNAITGNAFTGLNLLVILSFPLVAALAYLVIRLTGLKGALAIALAVAFSLIPYHWGRALGHTYLATLYSAVTGMALVLIVGTGRLERWRRRAKSRGRTAHLGLIALITVMVLVIAWTGIYYAAFTCILGATALLWRIAKGAKARALAWDALPFIAIVIMSVIAFLPGLLTTLADPPLLPLSERTAFESVLFAGSLAIALLPIPQSSLPLIGSAYNDAVLAWVAAAPFGESTVITNHGTWVTAAAAVVMLVGALIARRRRQPTGLGLIAALLATTLLFFIPWGLNYLFASTITAQIRAWNRLLPFLLLLLILGAATVLARARWATKAPLAVLVAVGVLGITALDSTLPFRGAYADSVREAAGMTKDAKAYADALNAAIPTDCGVLQLPYMGYPEFGVVRGINDYDHFWPALLNPGKQWSYGAVKNTDAGVWSAQLPALPTQEQASLLSGAGFCAVHLDLRGFISEVRPQLTDAFRARFGTEIATGKDGLWLAFPIAAAPASPEAVEAFLHQPLITPDPVTVHQEERGLEDTTWWTKDSRATFTITPTRAGTPVTIVRGAVAAPECGTLPITVTLVGPSESATTTLIGTPGEVTPFSLLLGNPSAAPVVLQVDGPGSGCAGSWPGQRFVQVSNLTSY